MWDKVCGVRRRLLGGWHGLRGRGAYEFDTFGPLGHCEACLSSEVVQVADEAGHYLSQSRVGFGSRGGDDSVGERMIVHVRAVLCGVHLQFVCLDVRSRVSSKYVLEEIDGLRLSLDCQ